MVSPEPSSPLSSQQNEQAPSNLSVKPILAAKKRKSHLLGGCSISRDLPDRLSGGSPHSGAIISKQLEQDRQCGFGMIPECPQFVRSSALKRGVVAVQGVDESRNHGTSLGGIDFGDRRSRHHSDKWVLALVLCERKQGGDGFDRRRPQVSQGRCSFDPDEGISALEMGDQGVEHKCM